MQRRVLAATIGLILTLSLTSLVTGCQNADANGRDDSVPGPSGPSSAPVPSDASASSGPGTGTSTGAGTGTGTGTRTTAPPGLPPQPDAEARARYAAALDVIDPRIVGGDVAGAVDRGRVTCQAIAAHMNHAKLITQTKQKFARGGYTVTTAHAEAIVRAANTHLCPSSGA